MAQQVTPQQRAALFATATRQNWQMQASKSVGALETAEFTIPKVRLTSRIRLLVEAQLTVTHASNATYIPAAFAPFTAIRRVSVDMNNGFSPFSVSGTQLYLYSLMRENAAILNRQTSGRGKVVQGTAASADGAANTIRFLADLPLTLNDRDAVGLILTQNQETTVTVTVDIDSAEKLATDASGFTYELGQVKITPMVESFSIPAVQEAFPDISTLKLVQAGTKAINGAGQVNYELPTGQTYRKIAFLIENESGEGIADADLSGDIEIVLNQADTPYRVNPKVLAGINHEQFGMPLPSGLYAFDFSYQGISNYGGARDYIDTERLTEFWLRFNATQGGKITVVYETLSRLRG